MPENETPAQQRPKFVEPRPGQRARIHLPVRTTASGKPIPVMRPGTPRRAYQEGEVVQWDDHFVSLRQEGAVLATEIVE